MRGLETMTLERGNSGLSPAVASAGMNWPWGWAVGGGTVAAAAHLLTSLPANILLTIPSAAVTGIFFFSLIGGGVMFLGSRGDRRARRYMGRHPWQVALVPAAVGGAGAAVATYVGAVFSGALISGIFGALFAGLGIGAVLWAILGVIGMVAGNKSSA
jgi:hypothetical protein